MIGVALFGLQQLTRGQCFQSCDDSLSNTALGSGAAANNTTGFYNTAIGFNALFFNTTGHYNTADPYAKTGSKNTAIGCGALGNNAGNNNDCDCCAGESLLYPPFCTPPETFHISDNVR